MYKVKRAKSIYANEPNCSSNYLNLSCLEITAGRRSDYFIIQSNVYYRLFLINFMIYIRNNIIKYLFFDHIFTEYVTPLIYKNSRGEHCI